MNQTPLLDDTQYQQLKSLMGEDFSALLTAFSADTEALFKDCQQSVQTNDIELGLRAAHSLKSTAASLGLVRLSDFAGQLEELGRQDALISSDQLSTLDTLIEDSLGQLS